MIIKGTKINDRYQIIRTIGEGGMANVYLAYDTILDRNVAVKVLRGDLASDEKFVRRFQREALSASSLSHPNIVEMYDVGEDDGQYYIVMEYVEGKTLKQLLKKRGSLTISEVLDIMGQLTEGLAHAHDSYIIHRDIKPQNIMILENGLIKITDFGIAMALNSTQLTQTNSVMGSVHYLPPEQASGKGCTIRSDIYSMGILMYELLCGSVPYKGDNAVEIALKHLKEPIPSIRKKLPELPQSIENIILKATAKNPQNRYKDAREMHQDLLTCMDSSKMNEEKYEYTYPEIENVKKEETKQLEKQAVEIKKKEKVNEDFEDEIMKEESSKQNKLLLILASVFTGLIIIVTAVVLLLPKISSDKSYKLPDVSGMKAVDAYNKLISEGFNVKDEYQLLASDEIDEGHVIKTSPEIGKLIKKSKEITLYVASGEASFVLEDYTGKNYIEVKTILSTMYQCNVIVEKQQIKEDKKITNEMVLSTSPGAGETIKYGATITIYIPEVQSVYPDFTTYTIAQVEEFAKKHSLNLTINYVENTLLADGTITYQSREKDSIVTDGVSLTITASKKPVIQEEDTSDEQ